MSLCKIKRVHSDLKSNPVLANLESSLSSSNVDFQTQFFHENKAKYVAVFDENCVYSGKIQNPKENLCHTLIAVRKRGSSKIVVHAVNTVSLSISRKCSSTLDTSATKSEYVKAEWNRKRATLTKQFGTKKAKRSTEVRERMKIDSEAISKDKMDITISNVDTVENESELMNVSETYNSSEYLVPINKDALTVNQVFKLSDYLTSADLKELEPDARVVLVTDIQNTECCEFIKTEIEKLQGSSCDYKEKEKIQRLIILMYVQCIIDFLNSPPNVFNKRGFQLFGKTLITAKILNLFTAKGQNGSRVRPASMKDKAVCYIMALLLMASENYTLDIEYLSASLKATIKKLQMFARVVGAKPKSTTCKTIIQVKLPLPEIKQGGLNQRSKGKSKN